MSKHMNAWRFALLALVTSTAVGLTIAYAQSPSKKRDVRGDRGRDSNRVVIQQTISTGGEAGTTNHHSLAAFQSAASEIAESERNSREQAIMKEHGTVVSPHPDSIGDGRLLQEKLAALLSQQALVPAQRLMHFGWCDTPDLGVRGWKGVIKGVDQTPEGIVVTLDMRPYLVSHLANITDTPDHVVETYLYDNGGLTFLDCKDSEGPVLKGAIFGD